MIVGAAKAVHDARRRIVSHTASASRVVLTATRARSEDASATGVHDSVEDAVSISNALPVAFQAAVFSRDIDAAMRVSRTIDASAVMINDHTAFRDDAMPFAGLRESGLGVGGIPYTMEDMQIDKMTVIRSPAR